MKQVKIKQPLAYYQNIMKPYTIKIEYCPRLDNVFVVVRDEDDNFEACEIRADDLSVYEGDLVKDWLLKMKGNLEERFRMRMRKVLLKGVKNDCGKIL